MHIAAHCFTNEADENYTTKEPEQFVVVVGKVSLDYGLRDSKSTKYHTVIEIYTMYIFILNALTQIKFHYTL